MKVYVAGPMTGIPEFNYPAFHAAAAQLRAAGFEVLNPAELNPDTGRAWEYYMRRDLAALVACEAVAVLPNWYESRGARLEVNVAAALSMPVLPVEMLLARARSEAA